MGAWGFLVDVVGPVAVGLLLIALGWAALERGRIHHQLARLRSGKDAAAHAGGWRAKRLLAGFFRFARGARRIRLAVSAVAGCGVA